MRAMNIAAPPRINLLGEILIFPSVIMISTDLLVFLGLISFFAAVYRIYLYVCTQHGGRSKHISSFLSFKPFMWCLVLIHWLPGHILIIKPELINFY